MALFDSADLLTRCKRLTARPATDVAPPTDATIDLMWYALLTEAQLHWVRELATHVPSVMYVFEKLTTADAGVTYDFTKEPLGNYEIRQSPTGNLLLPGPDWDPGADFVPAGQKIRFPGQKARSFANGPWSRYVQTPGVLDAANAPTLLPTHARQLLPPRAAIIWATRGGMRDPGPYQTEENKLWYGDPDRGELGILGSLKTQVFLQGSEAIPQVTVSDWWRYIDDGSGYR